MAKSTEEVIEKIEMYNKRKLLENPKLMKLKMASMDIEKFYPNILSEPSAKIIRIMWEDSELKIKPIHMEQLPCHSYEERRNYRRRS